MRHMGRPNDWSAILNALDVLAATASRQSNSGEFSTLRTGESWVERISREKWTPQQGLAIASAVVGVGAILYGARKLKLKDKSDAWVR